MRKTFKKCIITTALVTTMIVNEVNFTTFVRADETKSKTGVKTYLSNNNENELSDSEKEILKKKKESLSKSDEEKEVRVIVELSEKAVSDEKSIAKGYSELLQETEEEILVSQKKVISQVEKLTKAKVLNQTAYLINSFSINTKRKNIKKIAQIDGVKKVYEATVYKTEQGNKISKKNKKKNKTEIEEKMDKKYKGDGELIAILDTGVNYKHKDMQLSNKVKTKFSIGEWNKKIKELGYGEYKTQKVPFAYDYVEDDNEILSDDEENLGIMYTHGYHVSGIAAADGEKMGVAPNAQIVAMRVLDDDGMGTSDDILKAIEDSIKLGVDVINMSITMATAMEDKDDVLQSGLKKAEVAGIVNNVAVGNNSLAGTYEGNVVATNDLNMIDNGNVGNPAVSESCIAVGSAYVPGISQMDEEEKEFIEEYYQDFNMDFDRAYVSGFSSWGPTTDLKIKPEILAAGEEIYSTSFDDEYEIMSGTSMATPYISGAAAVVLQSLKDKNIKDKDVNNLVKTILMNTADIVMDSNFSGKKVKLPCSVRQQGAGLVNIDNAVETNAIATYKGKAKIELGRIYEGSNEIELKIKNYGKESVTYKLSDLPVYTDTTNKYNNAYGVNKLERAKITFEDKKVTVNANSTKSVEAKLILPEEMKKDEYYVESFVKLEGVGNTSLTLPLLAFYGNWEKEKILAESVYSDTGYSKYEKSALYDGDNGFILGEVWEDEKFLYKGNRVSFSPNDDDLKDNILVAPNLLRNANNVVIKVLDENMKAIRTIATLNNVSKNVDMFDKTLHDAYSLIGWDGKIYNKNTNKNEFAKDGQYYIQVSARLLENSKYESITMPIKVDTEKPNVKAEIKNMNDSQYLILNVADNVALKDGFYVGENKAGKYKTEDEEYLDSLDGEDEDTSKGSKIEYDWCQKNKKGEYVIDISELEMTGKACYVNVEDISGNIQSVKVNLRENITFTEEEKEPIHVNLQNGMCIKTVNGKYKVIIYTKNEDLKVKVNEIEAYKSEINDEYIAEVPTVENGKMKFDIEISDSKDNKVLKQASYTVNVDNTAPVINDVKIAENSIEKDVYSNEKENIIMYRLDLYDDEKQEFKTNRLRVYTDITEDNIDMKSSNLLCYSEYADEIINIPMKKDYKKNMYYFYITEDILWDIYNGELNEFLINIIDKAGNNTMEYILFVYDEETFEFYKEDDQYYENNKGVENFVTEENVEITKENINNSDITLTKDMLNKDMTFTYKGKMTDKIDSFKINDKKVKVNKDMTFSTNIDIKYGINKVSMEIVKNGVVNRAVYIIYYNDVEVKLDMSDADEKGIIYVDEATYELNVKIKSYIDSYNVNIDGENVLSYTEVKSSHDGNKIERNITYQIELDKGYNVVTIEVTDIGGNITTKKVKIYRY